MPTQIVAQMDVDHLALLRQNVERFLSDVVPHYCASGGLLLDVAPQDHAGARPFVPTNVTVETLDIDPKSGATFVADLCQPLPPELLGRFDTIVCTEVLEHTRQPFHATDNLLRMLRPGGLVFVTTPFNFRIHGPLPDCWRFTEHGLRELFKDFELIELQALESADRFLMPIQYTLVAKRPVA
jgi:hypothetical protein